MTTTIRTLQDICIDYLADTFEQLWTYSKDNQNKIVWCDPGLGLSGDVPEKLLYKLSEKRKLNDETLPLFQHEHACIRHLTIPDALQITKEGLKTLLASHRLLSLDICNSCLTLIDVLECLASHNWVSLKTLRCKNLNGMTLCPESLSDSSTRFFPRLDNVCCLSLIDLGLTNRCLDVITSNVPNLESLDISKNLNITNISPLQKHAERLQELIMNCLYMLTEVTTVDTLRKLKQLRHLDVSVEAKIIFHGTFHTRSLLMDPSTNPSLTSLELCGREEVTEEMLRAFLDAHPSLTFLGLLCNEASGYPMFDVKSLQYRPGIEVAGTSNLDQMTLLLRRYHKSYRSYYMHIHVWQKLCYADLSSMTTDNDDIIRALLEVMSVERSFGSWAQRCLYCLEKLLWYRCVSHIQPDTIKQLLRACCQVQCLTQSSQQTTEKEICLEQAQRIIQICKNLKTD